MRTLQDVANLVHELLALEAHDTLQARAEADLTSAFADTWFGVTLYQQELAQVGAKLALAALALQSAERVFARCPTDDTGAALDAARALVSALESERSHWQVQVEETLRSVRQTLVEAEVVTLRAQYLRWSEKLYRINPFDTALPRSFQRWLQRQRQLKRLEHEDNRLLALLEAREAKLHAWSFGTLPPSVAEPSTARSRREERLDHVLAQQFYHPNGDRRVDRDLSWGPGKPHDFSASTYDGLPSLPSLDPDRSVCSFCGADITDAVSVVLDPARVGDLPPNGRWKATTAVNAVVNRCDCGERVVGSVTFTEPVTWDAYLAAKEQASAMLAAFWKARRPVAQSI